MTDEQSIIRDCLAGNRDAFAPLVERYETHVKALAWNITGNREDALEVAQDTFFQAFKNLDRFQNERNFKSWLLGITIKRGIDKIRKKKTFLKFFNRYALESPLSKSDEPSYTTLQESPIFNPVLKKLNERERIALTLQMNENYSAKEIGQVINCSENCARVTLFNAKKKLKKILR